MTRSMPRRAQYRARIYQRDFFVVRALAPFLLHHVDQLVAPGVQLLDMGCGEQPLRSTIERLGGSYVGLDIVQNATHTVDVIGRATEVPLADESADIVLCTEVLEHVSDPAAVVREIARLLRPGGRAVITTPFLFPLHEEPYDFIRVTLHHIRWLAEENGLDVVELETAGNELEVIATLWCNLWSRLGHATTASGLTALKLARALARTPVNAGVAVGSIWFGRWLPRKAYLSTMSVVRKPR